MTIGTPSGRPFAVSSGMRRIVTVLAVAAVLATVWLAQPGTACNEQVCASVVSKCMLTASCKCDLKNCSCCKECYNCLSYLYTECCSCVGEFSCGNLVNDVAEMRIWVKLCRFFAQRTFRHRHSTKYN